MPPSSLQSLKPAFIDDSRHGQKPKTLPCRHCQKRFRRLEHVQRHERTHTKEKPFACSCGKTFGRRDLLVRHEKLVHQVESSRSRTSNAHITKVQSVSPNILATPLVLQPPLAPSSLIDPELLAVPVQKYSGTQLVSDVPGEALRCSLDLLSDAANDIASKDSSASRQSQAMLPKRQHGNPSIEITCDDAYIHKAKKASSGSSALVDDYDVVVEGFSTSNYFLSSSHLDSDQSSLKLTRSEVPLPNSAIVSECQKSRYGTPKDEGYTFSRYASRLSSLQPELQEACESWNPPGEGSARSNPPWRISVQDHRDIQAKLDNFSSVIHKDFQLPSRHTLSRFLEGYINGFHENLPFLHVPTFVATHCAPELLLALVAVGAQYRFEGHKGYELWVASKSIATEQIRRRNTHCADSRSPSTSGADSVEHNDLATTESKIHQGIPRLKTTQATLESIQALLLLVVMGTWGPRALLRESSALQSQLILLVREQGLAESDINTADKTWEDWIKFEGERRTKFIVYCFFNLQSIASDTPPSILTSEIKLDLPRSSKEWMIGSAWQWHEFQRTSASTDIGFHDALTTLFLRPAINNIYPPISTFGNYVLIHALIQHIFLLRQTSATNDPTTRNSSLKHIVVDELSQALEAWQVRWEQNPESSLNPSNPYGAVALNSIALWRLAYIRLYSDLGPHRFLDSRDPSLIATALRSSPLLIRSAGLSRAVLQSTHALSLPVKMGVNFVARTHPFSWSIQHSLCNLECALLLNKWLETIASSSMDLDADEQNVLEMVQRMLGETEFAVSWDLNLLRASSDERAKIRELSAAVVRLWAEAFKGPQVFAIVKIIGYSLEIYADLMEKANDAAAE